MNEVARDFTPVSKEDVAWLGTAPVPAKPYYDPAYFELEREAVFRRSWLQIGHVCELPEPGSFIRRDVEVLKASVLIVRGKDGKIRAFHNVCTHRGTQLVEEMQGKASRFTCPYHSWTFSEDGSLLSAPDFDAFHVTKEECALPHIHLEVIAGLIFLHFGAPERSLREELGPMAERMEQLPVARATTFSEYVYEIDANWKITYDNFQENYHLRFIHPSTAGPGCAPPNPFGYPEEYGFHGEHRTQTIWSNPKPGAPKPVQGISYMRIGASLMKRNLLVPGAEKNYFAIFPSFFLFGNPATHFSHTVYPIAANKSRGVIRLWWVGDDANASERYAREYGMAITRDIHVEDRSVIERGQRGLESGALKHIHLQANEALIRHLFNVVDSRVQAYKAELEAQGIG
ncbi:MAG: aromatic ring-hydroxylating dioxygenase subunit alpha [Novosphingobium sp.]|nr:aromatic ring-hydroxylating dioxygenase subunit alpha [Novosphingobium sp.]